MTDQNNNLIWTPGTSNNNTAAGQVPNTLFGRPVIVTEKASALGAKGDLMFVAQGQYCVSSREDVTIDTTAAYWKERLISFRATVRVDGRSLWDKPITPMNGGNTLSWCVILDTP